MRGIGSRGCQVFLQFVKNENRAFTKNHLVLPQSVKFSYQVNFALALASVKIQLCLYID